MKPLFDYWQRQVIANYYAGLIKSKPLIVCDYELIKAKKKFIKSVKQTPLWCFTVSRINKLFDNKSVNTCSLAYEIATFAPYNVYEIQLLIDDIKVYNGFDRHSKEAEGVFIVKTQSYEAAYYAYSHGITLNEAASIVYHKYLKQLYASKRT